MQQRHLWASRDDWYRAYQVIAGMEEELMGTCLQQLLDSNDRLYRLLDSGLNGTAYTADGEIITPAIPAVPATPTGITSGLRRQLLDAQGEVPAWFGLTSRPVTQADILGALRQGSSAEAASLSDALDLLSAADSALSIYDRIKSAVVDGADLTLSGGTFAAQVITMAAQVQASGMQLSATRQIEFAIRDLQAALDRLVTSIDGGATPAPTTNIIAELQDVNEKLV
jgi:hypothetical protein